MDHCTSNSTASPQNRYIDLELLLLLSLAALAYCSFFPVPKLQNRVLINTSLYALLEISCAIIVIILAFILINKRETEYGDIYLPLAAGFLYMGVFGILHASAAPGNDFIALYTIANLMGGFCFALIYLSGNKWITRHIKSEYIFMVLVMLFIPLSIWVFLYGNTLPRLLQNLDFTFSALTLNFLAGIFSLAAAGRLFFLFHRHQKMELYLFTCIAAFRGLAGLLYMHSSLWTIDWWFWYGLRIVSYIFALGFLIYEYHQLIDNLQLTVSEQRKTEAELIKHRNHLEDLVNDRTAELQKAHDELEQRVEERTSELRTTYSQLLHAEKFSTLGKFIANVAHEFKNPLCGIKMIVQELGENTKLSGEGKKLSALVLEEIDRLFRMLENLRDFYRPSEGVMLPLDINQAIKELLEFCEKDLSLNNIQLEKDFAEDMPAIPAVADQMKQVFLNLINNAKDAMLQSGGGLYIQTKAGKDKVSIIFKDEGVGIRQENMERIFDPFFTTKAGKGTGLGLSVSYEIVKRHGGEILVESTPRKGTTFTIELPYPAERTQ